MISRVKKGLIFFGNFFVPFTIMTIMEIYYNISNIKSYFVIALIILLTIISIISLAGFIYLFYLIKQSSKLGYEKRDIYMIGDMTKSDLTFYLMYWLIMVLFFYVFGIIMPFSIYAIIGLVIGILLSMNDDIHTMLYNPILYLMGYRHYQVNVKNDDHDICIISNKKLEKGIYKFYMITDYLFYYDKMLIEKGGDEKMNEEMELKENEWYIYRFGKQDWLIKRIKNVLFGFKIYGGYISKREQKYFIKFAYEHYLNPIVVFNKFIVDDILCEIDINIKHIKIKGGNEK